MLLLQSPMVVEAGLQASCEVSGIILRPSLSMVLAQITP